MKAVRIHYFGGPEVLGYEDVPRPEPGQGEALNLNSNNQANGEQHGGKDTSDFLQHVRARLSNG